MYVYPLIRQHIYDVTITALETLKTQLITYDVIMKNRDKVRDVRSLACKIKDIYGLVPGT